MQYVPKVCGCQTVSTFNMILPTETQLGMTLCPERISVSQSVLMQIKVISSYEKWMCV